MRKKYYVESGAIQSILLSEDLDVAAIDFLVGVFDDTIKGVDPEDKLSILIFVSEAGFSQDVLKDGTKEQWESVEFFRTSQMLSKIDNTCTLIKDFEDQEKVNDEEDIKLLKSILREQKSILKNMYYSIHKK